MPIPRVIIINYICIKSSTRCYLKNQISVGQEIFLECVEQALTEIREINAAITRLIKAVNPKKFSYKEEVQSLSSER